jgi:hypothetical protein
MSDNNNNKVTEPSKHSVFEALERINDILKIYSNSEQNDILKMVCSTRNLKVESTFKGPIIIRDRVPINKKKRSINKVSDPEVKKVKDKIKLQNKLIKEKSDKIGKILDDSDPLIKERNQLFENLKGIPNNKTSPADKISKEASNKN